MAIKMAGDLVYNEEHMYDISALYSTAAEKIEEAYIFIEKAG